MRLYLIRHARTNNNVERLTQGLADNDLDEVGHEQAEALAGYFGERELRHIFSSDLRRAVETATPTSLLKNVEIQTTPLLRERSLGKLENAPIAALRKAFDDEVARTGRSRYRIRPMGVESAYDVMARAIEFTRLMPNDQRDTAIFTHGMMKEVLLCYLIGAPVESSRSFCFDNAAVTVLRWEDDIWVMESYNDIRHVPNPLRSCQP